MRYRAIDSAGNTSKEGRIGLKLDKTAPTVTVSGLTAGASYGDSGSVTLDWAITDATAGPGINPESALLDGKRVARGATIELSGLPLGAHTVVVTAKDRAGNSTTRTILFTTTASFTDLRAHVDRYQAAGTISASNAGKLIDSLSKASAAAGDGRTEEAVAHLDTFLNQAGGLNAVGARNLLVRDAQALIIEIRG